MIIFLASDHAGYDLKGKLLAYLEEQEHTVSDMGPHEYQSGDDYPDFVAPCAEKVAHTEGSFGIVLGWSGHGEAMVANRVQGVRAATFYGPHTQAKYEIVKLAREHNDANILSLGAHFVTEEEAKEAVRIFLGTPFSNDERHVRRLKKF